MFLITGDSGQHPGASLKLLFINSAQPHEWNNFGVWYAIHGNQPQIAFNALNAMWALLKEHQYFTEKGTDCALTRYGLLLKG